MKSKYRFYDLKAKGGALPEDVNSFIENGIKGKLSNEAELLALLKRSREKHVFGRILHYEKIARFGHELVIDAAVFVFRYGVIQQVYIKQVVDESNIEERTILNDLVSFTK